MRHVYMLLKAVQATLSRSETTGEVGRYDILYSWTHYITYDHFLWQTITLKILSYTELDYVPGGAAPRLSSSRCGGFPPRRRIAAGAVAMQSPCRVYIYINTYISIYIYTYIYIYRALFRKNARTKLPQNWYNKCKDLHGMTFRPKTTCPEMLLLSTEPLCRIMRQPD